MLARASRHTRSRALVRTLSDHSDFAPTKKAMPADPSSVQAMIAKQVSDNRVLLPASA